MPTLLDCDLQRPDGDAYIELSSRLAVRITCEVDAYAEAGYPGSFLWWASETCMALVEEFDEEFGDLPLRHRIARGRDSTYLPVDPAYLARLMSGKAPAGVPKFVIARWAQILADRNDGAECYAQCFVDGLLVVRIQVEVDGLPAVVRSISGVPSGFANVDYLREAISDAVDETLELMGDSEGEYRYTH